MVAPLWEIFLLAFALELLPQCVATVITTHGLRKEYDFIVVGGGTAGNVIANRLTENSLTTVLLIEAGGDNNVLESEVPFLSMELIGTEHDWNYTTTPQVNLNGTVLPYPRGRMLGGSSSINSMFYTRGSPEDYDRIAELTGDIGWSWDKLQPYIRKNERWTPPADHHPTTGQFDPAFHCLKGINSVSLSGFSLPIDDRVIQTTGEKPDEFPFNLDLNSDNQLGIGWAQFTINDGTRSSSAASYLASKYRKRSNLHILLHSQVTRVLPATRSTLRSPNIRSVEFADVSKGTNVNSPRVTVHARKEVVLSAGSFGSPNILLHSGIGNRNTLSSVGIPTVHHLPSVGQNLSDHAVAAIIWLVNSTDTLDTFQRNATLVAEALAEWKRSRSGVMSSIGGNLIGFLRLPDSSSIFDTITDPAPGPNIAHYELIILDGTVNPPPEGNFLLTVVTLFTPMSRGFLTINSTNPFDHPVINPNLLSEPFDIFALRESLRSAARMMSSDAWKGYILGPTGGLTNMDISDDSRLNSYIRASAGAGYHIVGTSGMTPRGASYGVTDPDLKVKGVDGLRIVDASVLPLVPSAHTQAPTYIVAERAADLIKKNWRLSS